MPFLAPLRGLQGKTALTEGEDRLKQSKRLRSQARPMNPPTRPDKLQDKSQDSIVSVGNTYSLHDTRRCLCVAYARSALRFFLQAI